MTTPDSPLTPSPAVTEPTDAMIAAGVQVLHNSTNKGARDKVLRIYRAMAALAQQAQPAEVVARVKSNSGPGRTFVGEMLSYAEMPVGTSLYAAPPPQSASALSAPQPVGEPVAWPTMPPSKGQSPVLFEDGYAEGWAKCMAMCQAAVGTHPLPDQRGEPPSCEQHAPCLWEQFQKTTSEALVKSEKTVRELRQAADQRSREREPLSEDATPSPAEVPLPEPDFYEAKHTGYVCTAQHFKQLNETGERAKSWRPLVRMPKVTAYASAVAAQRMEGMRAALQELVKVIDAAGLYNLSRGVELGPTVWFVKATEKMDAARAVLANSEGGPVS